MIFSFLVNFLYFQLSVTVKLPNTGDQSNPNQVVYGILTISLKGFKLHMLFHPFEERIYLPKRHLFKITDLIRSKSL